jgi:hypothetical protein
MSWFLQSKGNVLGPYSEADFRKLATSGVIGAESPISQSAAGPWHPASSVAGLFDELLSDSKRRRGASVKSGTQDDDRRAALSRESSAIPTVAARRAEGCPNGTYLLWPSTAFGLLLLLALGGASVGAGGELAGFLIAFALNPITWAAAYCFSRIGHIRCPHCRKSSALGPAQKYPVGSAITCDKCGNDFSKPVG